MTNYHSNWIFDLGLKLAVVMCLATLATALFAGVGPITALFRSGAAFTVFAILSWAAALIWRVPKADELLEEEAAEKDTANQTSKEKTAKTKMQAGQDFVEQVAEQMEQ